MNTINEHRDRLLEALGRFSTLFSDLIDGIHRDDLDRKIRTVLGGESVPESAAVTARMNLIGSLRSEGFVILGGRAGGKTYQVLAFSEPTDQSSRPSVDKWPIGLSKSTYDWVHSLPRFSNALQIYPYLARREPSFDEMLHENSPMYARAYECGRDLGWLLIDGDNSALVLQRHRNYPRFRLFELYAEPQWLLQMAETLSSASTHSVTIVNVRASSSREMRDRQPRGSWLRRVEAIYNVKKIAESPDLFLNSRAMTMLRSNRKKILFVRDTQTDDNRLTSESSHLEVISLWRRLNEYKHRQLAITRDTVAVTEPYPALDRFSYFGVDRDSFTKPCIHHLFTRLANFPNVVSLMNEKSLNYRQFPDGTDVPGGRPGLSDLNQVLACEDLYVNGIEFIQSGGIDGGGAGLPHKKKKFAEAFVESRTYYTPWAGGAPK